ncbi:MAG: 1-deoxy-D-xylulose-5-phosphate synthase [Nitrospirae bacterium]|nr:1-deoxy-D-xylulose-5-phosphate synthase [Nitrospirota bacterium]
MNNISQRDAFWNRVYEIARKDTDVVVVSADMGAPALDKFRRDMPSQFVNAGIAEQNAVTIAAGLCLAGKKVFVYAIAPFITLRCLEQIRVENAIMDIPITLVGVGAGFGYEDSGPTHHIIEDIAIMRSMPRIQINSITDSVMASAFADISCDLKTTNYVRLDRQVLPDLYNEGSDFSKGLSILRESDDCYIISTGSMTHTAVDIARHFGERNINIGVIDVYSIPVNGNALAEKIRNAKKLISLEEHFLPGGLGSAVCEVLNDRNIPVRVKRLGLSTDRNYCYKYGGREAIRSYYGVDMDSLKKEIAEYLSVGSLCGAR